LPTTRPVYKTGRQTLIAACKGGHPGKIDYWLRGFPGQPATPLRMAMFGVPAAGISLTPTCPTKGATTGLRPDNRRRADPGRLFRVSGPSRPLVRAGGSTSGVDRGNHARGRLLRNFPECAHRFRNPVCQGFFLQFLVLRSLAPAGTPKGHHRKAECRSGKGRSVIPEDFAAKPRGPWFLRRRGSSARGKLRGHDRRSASPKYARVIKEMGIANE